MGMIRGFRANIIFTFAASLFLSMILILLVVTSYYRKERLSQIDQIARLSLSQMVGAPLWDGTDFSVERLSQALPAIVSPYKPLAFVAAYALKRDGGILTQLDRFATIPESTIRQTLRSAAAKKKSVVIKLGNRWVFPGRIARYLLICQPMRDYANFKAMGLLIDLAPVRHEVVKLNNLMLTYFMVNLVLFSAIGVYRLTHIYMRPIKRMVKRAEDFREEDALFFTARIGDDEINHLSKSLNLLLSRISEDKRQLKQTVAELEVSNTNLKKAQDEVVRAETLASVGRLASGVAHEIGNPLGIVLGYLDLLSNPEIGATERKEYLKRTESEIERINGIIRQLLDLSRPADSQVDLIHLHEILNDTVAIVGPQPLMKNIVIELQLDAVHDSVLAAPEQLRQVFLNLLLNAADAIATEGEGEGRILIKTGLVSGDVLASHPSSEVIELLFEDNGPGIAKEMQGHIFEPFFTTKDPGKGTGLGLSVSFMIIENLKGHLAAEQKEQGGMRMRIQLPLYAGEAST
jgi:two-component system, NtrC family, sensor kinase